MSKFLITGDQLFEYGLKSDVDEIDWFKVAVAGVIGEPNLGNGEYS